MTPEKIIQLHTLRNGALAALTNQGRIFVVVDALCDYVKWQTLELPEQLNQPPDTNSDQLLTPSSSQK